ncbi:hypothetical protein [Zhenhengia yiwuensis]|jgi:hypothetical protein|uniref:Uncharacterized protein n=1 Tax=Zhenhengia yiwuensis TaxID=2763666 RepID=A0A926EFJ7_9FIRM|nr:hypothetical protein [Zhenhengia yiwuensis]MBC8580166.1 hypothetical protein [Zhenhengia yiwuensis]DAV39045.1 MAG TPA: 14-3-3 protein gamma [Caudoviricetes sp.]
MKNCFAIKRGKCTALKYKVCEGCSFYKTKAQLKKEQEKTRRRIAQLDNHTQAYITDKYDCK